MKAKIKPTEKPEKLVENLRKRVDSVSLEKNILKAEVNEINVLRKTPGIESFKTGDKEMDGIGGKPVDEMAYASIESWEDASKAFLATLNGYNLVILETERKWDLRKLRQYNPDIKHIKSKKPVEELGINKSIQDFESTKRIELDIPGHEELELIYREKLT